MEKPKKLYAEAMIRWGVPAQIDRCIEQMADLIKAFLTLRREKEKSSLAHRYVQVYQEIGNVEIMLATLRECFDPKQIDEYKQVKLRDLEKKLREAEENEYKYPKTW